MHISWISKETTKNDNTVYRTPYKHKHSLAAIKYKHQELEIKKYTMLEKLESREFKISTTGYFPKVPCRNIPTLHAPITKITADPKTRFLI